MSMFGSMSCVHRTLGYACVSTSKGTFNQLVFRSVYRPSFRKSVWTGLNRARWTIHNPQQKLNTTHFYIVPLRRGFNDNRFRGRFYGGVGLQRHWIAITAFSLLFAIVIGATSYYIWLYQEIVEKPLAAYPSQVSSHIKRALYYASRNDMVSMTNKFKAAISAAEAVGMHPLSDEVAGLKVECASLLVKLDGGKFKEKAVEILEGVLDEAVAGAEYFRKEGRKSDRDKVLKRAILLGYRIGEVQLELNKVKSAEEAMVWSTNTLLREIYERRDVGNSQSQETGWFEDDDIVKCLETMANHYERTSQHRLAAPLYLQAIRMSSVPTCHVVTLMTNLAASLSQQVPAQESGIGRDKLLENAENWTRKALQISTTIKTPLRSPECDEACVVATHNMGELAEMLGDKHLATRKYREALAMARKLGLQHSIEHTTLSLKRINPE